jgi:putative Mg2+ transporter-C (MgtC) family protein
MSLAETVQTLQLDLVFRIVLGFFLGGALGLEREWRDKPAGLRTHMLVGGGAAMYTVASYALWGSFDVPRDPARIAAQVVVGVGFLGGGAILRSGLSVIGLTTAATIWVSAAVGMLAGGGGYSLAIAGTLMSVLVLRLPERLFVQRGRQRLDEPTPDERD